MASLKGKYPLPSVLFVSFRECNKAGLAISWWSIPFGMVSTMIEPWKLAWSTIMKVWFRWFFLCKTLRHPNTTVHLSVGYSPWLSIEEMGLMFFSKFQPFIFGRKKEPGDSIRALFHPLPSSWRSLNPLKGSLNHPKKVTAWITRNELFVDLFFPGSLGAIVGLAPAPFTAGPFGFAF